MRIRLDYLSKTVFQSIEITYNRSDLSSVTFDELYLLTGDDSFSAGKLYIGAASQLPALPPAGEEGLITILCVEDRPLPGAYRAARNIFLIQCPPVLSVQELFNRVNRLVTANVRIPDRLWAFLGQIAEGANFTQLVHSISSILGCSCVLLSQGFKMLGCCELPDVPATRTLHSILEHKYYPYTDQITQIRPNRLSVFDAETRRLAESPDDYPQIGDALYPLLSEDKHQETLGFLYFSYHDREGLTAQFNAIQFIAYALSFRMWRYMNSPSNSNSVLCFLLRDILSGAISDDAEIAKRLENIHYVPAKYNLLIVIYTSAMDNLKYSLRHLRTVFGQLFPDDVLLSYNSDIVLLISSRNPDVLPKEKTDALTLLLREHDCFAGISSCFSQIDRSLKNYYVRTMAAAKMARTYNMASRYSTYTDIALLHFIQGGSSTENLRDLCDPRVLRLAEYDRSHSSDYIYTLQCYWHFNQNIQSTCDRLFIHRNTLFYRLKKIRQIADLDVNNPKHLLQFNLSFAILTALGDIPYNDFPPEPAGPSE